MELLRSPVGPSIHAGGNLSFTTFIVDQAARPVDHYSATCEPVAEDVV
jgi:hypothetical protein